MKVNAIKCINCGDIIFSRARHDCRGCTCGEVYIDGGFDYTRIGGQILLKTFEFETKASKKELYDDWNNMKDKYGLVKTRSK